MRRTGDANAAARAFAALYKCPAWIRPARVRLAIMTSVPCRNWWRSP